MKIEYLRGENVISIQPIRSQVKFPAIAQVEAYWEGLRNGRPMPARSEVDPRGISDALEFAFILEKIAPGMARIRLAGSHLNDLLGMEVRGMPITSLFLPEARIEVQKALETAFSSPASVRLNLAGDKGMTRPNLEAQMFFAPLRDEKGAPTRVLGALQSNGRIGRAPRRFNVRSTEVNALFGEVGTGSQAQQNAAKPREIPGYEAYKTELKAQPVQNVAQIQPAQKSHLTLVYNSDA